jgi:hypothetical protein
LQGQKPRIIDTMTRSQRALVGTIEASIKAVEEAEEVISFIQFLADNRF